MIDVKMPRTSDEIEESLIVFWHVEEGDSVEEGDILVEVQTEKAVFEIEAETEGTISEILVKRGESAKVGEILAKIDTGRRDEAKDAEPEDDNKDNGGRSPAASGEQSFIRVSPRLRKLARDLNVNLAEVKGTGKGGSITERDIKEMGEGGKSQQKTSLGKEISGIRKTIASRMMTSLHESAQLTLTSWVDVTDVNKSRKETGSNISLNSLISFAAVKALEQHPAMNAHVQGEQVIQHEKVHLGMAVDTEDGLYVPVIPEADELSLAELDRELKEISKNVKAKNLSAATLTGSTFTVTNLGNLGIEFFTPIINPPEVGILGVGKMDTHLVLEGGEVIQKERIPLSLTFDHRVVDGAPAAEFLQTIADQCQTLINSL